MRGQHNLKVCVPRFPFPGEHVPKWLKPPFSEDYIFPCINTEPASFMCVWSHPSLLTAFSVSHRSEGLSSTLGSVMRNDNLTQ